MKLEGRQHALRGNHAEASSGELDDVPTTAQLQRSVQPSDENQAIYSPVFPVDGRACTQDGAVTSRICQPQVRQALIGG